MCFAFSLYESLIYLCRHVPSDAYEMNVIICTQALSLPKSERICVKSEEEVSPVTLHYLYLVLWLAGRHCPLSCPDLTFPIIRVLDYSLQVVSTQVLITTHNISPSTASLSYLTYMKVYLFHETVT